MGHYASEMGFMDDRPEPMTERPEERDSLADVVKRLDEVANYGVADTLSPLSAELLVIARTLINEVKERDEALRKIRDRDLEWDDEEGMVAVAEGVIGSKDRPE